MNGRGLKRLRSGARGRGAGLRDSSPVKSPRSQPDRAGERTASGLKHNNIQILSGESETGHNKFYYWVDPPAPARRPEKAVLRPSMPATAQEILERLNAAAGQRGLAGPTLAAYRRVWRDTSSAPPPPPGPRRAPTGQGRGVLLGADPWPGSLLPPSGQGRPRAPLPGAGGPNRCGLPGPQIPAGRGGDPPSGGRKARQSPSGAAKAPPGLFRPSGQPSGRGPLLHGLPVP